VVLEDEALASLDDKIRDKFIVYNKLKAEKVKDALEKTCLKEVERKKKQDERPKRRQRRAKKRPM
jgi:hypothetical protein